MATASPRSFCWSRWASLALAVIVATVVVDQLHKFWMLSVFDIESKGRVEVFPFLDLVYVKNIGISYSLFNQESMLGQ
jgi:signal peptidase II